MSEVRLRAQIATLHWTMESGHIANWDLALDCGAYEGHWTLAMAKRFGRVIAFEPSTYNFARAEQTLRHCANVDLHRTAVFDGVTTTLRMIESRSKHSAAHYVQPDPAGTVFAQSVDSLYLDACGLIKLDVEGAEFDALQGARHTIKRFRPVLIVEIKGLETRFGHPPDSVRRLLHRWSYECVHEARPDFVYVSAR